MHGIVDIVMKPINCFSLQVLIYMYMYQWSITGVEFGTPKKSSFLK